MDFHLAHLLSFPNTAVETCQYSDNLVVIKVTLLNTGIYCPHCDRFTEDINQNRPILVRDLSAFGKKIYLEVPRRQFFCSNCHFLPKSWIISMQKDVIRLDTNNTFMNVLQFQV